MDQSMIQMLLSRLFGNSLPNQDAVNPQAQQTGLGPSMSPMMEMMNTPQAGVQNTTQAMPGQMPDPYSAMMNAPPMVPPPSSNY